MTPRQAALIEDARIKELEDVAVKYAEIRDERMALNKSEAELKVEALRLMKKHKKKSYVRDGIEISIEPAGEETIKVRVKKPAEDEDPDA